jgi:hypothetical protein
MCNPSCADLPRTPQKKRKEITLKTEKLKPKKERVLSTTFASKAKMTA